jgi:hypothetical protein
MTNTTQATKRETSKAVRLNGAVVGKGSAPTSPEVQRALRGVALSDSPVLVRAEAEQDRRGIANTLHVLGRRKALPMHECKSAEDALPLFRGVLGKIESALVFGTWALYGVASWSKEQQRELCRVLGALDEHRLHGRLSHERMPRVIVLEGDNKAALEPELARRLSFFCIATSQAA